MQLARLYRMAAEKSVPVTVEHEIPAVIKDCNYSTGEAQRRRKRNRKKKLFKGSKERYREKKRQLCQDIDQLRADRKSLLDKHKAVIRKNLVLQRSVCILILCKCVPPQVVQVRIFLGFKHVAVMM